VHADIFASWKAKKAEPSRVIPLKARKKPRAFKCRAVQI